jgi:hypothetical protein
MWLVWPAGRLVRLVATLDTLPIRARLTSTGPKSSKCRQRLSAWSIHFVPSMRVTNAQRKPLHTALGHIIFGRETYMAESRKIALAASRNGVMAGLVSAWPPIGAPGP